jgi:hypothetical protein
MANTSGSFVTFAVIRRAGPFGFMTFAMKQGKQPNCADGHILLDESCLCGCGAMWFFFCGGGHFERA